MDLKPTKLKDVALHSPAPGLAFSLKEVGLENVATQVRLNGQSIPARAVVTVSLNDPQSRGIHMSRLYRLVSQLDREELSWSLLHSTLEQMLATHEKLSDSGRLMVQLDWPLWRKALISQEGGWRHYPTTLEVNWSKGGQRNSKMIVHVLYSSTCPCSAALSRQALAEEMAKKFTDETLSKEEVLSWLSEVSISTPHSQRSEARCELKFVPGRESSTPEAWIDLVEKALGTPVQAAVKREDEQEFARLNGQNLMFCEDAARRLKAALNPCEELADFEIEVRHFESLHAHDVVAKVRK